MDELGQGTGSAARKTALALLAQGFAHRPWAPVTTLEKRLPLSFGWAFSRGFA